MVSVRMRAIPALKVQTEEGSPLWYRLVLALEDSVPTKASSAGPSVHAVPWHGSMEEFEQFFRQHEREIYAYLWRMTGDEHAAFDLAQETFLRAWQHFARIRDYERPGGWLFRVATHLALNHLRGRARHPSTARALDADRSELSAAAHPGGRSEDLATRVADTDMVRRSLMAISARQRAALVLREVYGLSCEQVAAALGTSVGGAKTLLWRARDEFRSRYAEEDR